MISLWRFEYIFRLKPVLELIFMSLLFDEIFRFVIQERSCYSRVTVAKEMDRTMGILA